MFTTVVFARKIEEIDHVTEHRKVSRLCYLKRKRIKCMNLARFHCDLKQYLSRAAFFSCGGFEVYPLNHVTKDFRNAPSLRFHLSNTLQYLREKNILTTKTVIFGMAVLCLMHQRKSNLWSLYMKCDVQLQQHNWLLHVHVLYYFTFK